MKKPIELFKSAARNQLKERLANRGIALFLDYDGTLTPIVNDPAAATLNPASRRILGRLAEQYKVTLVSGRDLKVLQNFVQLDNVYYAGSHGFDIVGPDNLHKRNRQGEQCLPQLDQAENELRDRLTGISGCEIERKAFALAIHYRNVDPVQIQPIDQAIGEIAEKYGKLRRGGGKKVFELQPDVDWNKGRAVLWLIEALKLDPDRVTPIYIGDDLTDEDAFEALAGTGIGIYVGDLERSTAAEYRLENVEQVIDFLQTLIPSGASEK